MGYVLGVDLGTTFSAAATVADGRAEIFPLGNRAAAIPSIVLLREDGEVLVGEAAERRALTEPTRTAREFKRRLGDPTPLLLGGTPYGAEALTAHLLRAIVAQVIEQRGARPDTIVISHPANYGPYKKDLLAEAVRQADVGPVTYVAEPVAAAVHYASQERLESGQYVAVYDFGGGTFDAAVLRRTDAGFELVGEPEGMERIGGIDFDRAVFAHVDGVIDGAASALDPNDPMAVAALARLRDESRAAKEALSADTDATIPVLLPGVQTEVRITRGEFETMIRPRVAETIESLQRAIRSAGISVDDIAKILLVGGSSRIPLVGQMVREATGRPVAVDAHPKFAIAIGAAIVGATAATTEDVTAIAAPAPDLAAEPATTPVSTPPPPVPPAATPAPAPASRAPDRAESDGEGRRSPALLGALALLLVVAIGGIAYAAGAFGGGDDPGPAASETQTPSGTPTSAQPTRSAGPEPSDTPTTAGTELPTAALPGGRYVRIDAITVVDGAYAVEYTPFNYEPLIGQAEHEYHIHFFWDTVAPIDAGTNQPGADGDNWKLYDLPSPFTGYAVRDRPEGAAQMCALVADHQHRVTLDSGNCVDLPAG